MGIPKRVKGDKNNIYLEREGHVNLRRVCGGAFVVY